MKKVSIVLPVYNGADRVGDAIESILKQTYENWELIVVNDCSTDNSREIIEYYAEKDKRVFLINNKNNLKLPGSLNVGFSHATGDYYTWTSDDNMYLESAVATLAGQIEQDHSIGMVYSNYTNIDSEGNLLDTVVLDEPAMLPFGNVVGACFLYKREVADTVGFYDENLFLAEDYDYWIRVYKKCKLFHLPDNLYLYRKHKNSLSETRSQQVKLQTYRVLEKHFLFLYARLQGREKYRFLDRILELAEHAKENQVCATLQGMSFGYGMHRWRIKNLIHLGL